MIILLALMTECRDLVIFCADRQTNRRTERLLYPLRMHAVG